MDTRNVLGAQHLTVSLVGQGGVSVLDDVTLTVRGGEFVGVVGESGSGKSILAEAVLGLLPKDLYVSAGEIQLLGQDHGDRLSEEQYQRLRGGSVSLILANPRIRLNPLLSCEQQITNVVRAKHEVAAGEARERSQAMLKAVGLPPSTYALLPSELSGGMCQRVVIAMALVNAPQLLIADEPAGGLDVTVQRQILDLMRQLVEEQGAGTLILTRDLGIVAQYCQRVVVLHDGRVEEQDDVRPFFRAPQSIYGRALLAAATLARSGGRLRPSSPAAEELNRTSLASTPRTERVRTQGQWLSPASSTSPNDSAPILQVEHLVKHFPARRAAGVVHAVGDVSFAIYRGETLGLIGETGSGKTTVGRCVAGLIAPTSGRITVDGKDINDAKRGHDRDLRFKVQMVFQEPRESLDPRMSLGEAVEEPMLLQHRLSPVERRRRVDSLFEMVGVPKRVQLALPHQRPAGELQRICIARAMAPQPDLLILDEATSSLDLSVRAEVIELLRQLQVESGVAYLFISHDLTAVQSICDRVAVMYLGRLIEHGDGADLFAKPLHPYSMALLSAALYPDPTRVERQLRLEGEIPSPVTLPTGCSLHPRCPFAVDRCRQDAPELLEWRKSHYAACLRVAEIGSERDGSREEQPSAD